MARGLTIALFALLLTSAEGPGRIVEAGDGGRTGVDVPTFHGDRARRGWNAREVELTPTRVASGAFGPLWSSPALHAVTLDGITYAPHLYATPLYADHVRITAGPCAGRRLSVVLAASSNGWVYAVAAFAARCHEAIIRAGTVVWQTPLGTPAVVPALDGGVLLGVLSTPTMDLALDPPRLYVTAMDAAAGWRAFALDLGSGRVLPGWPLSIDESGLASINANGPARFAAATRMSQRGALNLSPRGDLLYVVFGGRGPGWIVAIDTRRPRILAAFGVAPGEGEASSGGMWSAGGPAVDSRGRVYMTTGNSRGRSLDTPRVWGSSLLQWSPTLRLSGTYTPFNYCVLDQHNMDLGASSPVLLPDLDPAATATPRLLAFGGKQGTVYLVDRDRLPGGLDHRPPCLTDASTDASLLPPEPQAQFASRGPLNVFGPYTETHAQLDHARMRTTPAYYRDDAGIGYLFVSGATKAGPASAASVPPGLVKLRVVTAPGAPAHLAVHGRELRTTLVNPGSPVVTSNGSRDAIVWVLDPNLPRLAPLRGTAVSRPVLYAFDAMTLDRLWRSAPEELHVGGKYASPTVARGLVLVGTDRIQAFGLRRR
jgi:hypothetical protein